MAAQGRKNVRGKTGVRFKAAYTTSKRKNMLRNVVTELVIHEKVIVTTSVVSDLKKLADHLITLAKRGDLHARRQAASILRQMN
ncbi:MAG: L17 family ribosomal protein, partial [Bacilli bacterium]|nr:L17 family ribosomal protein [Bacilli bacterium]